MKLIVFKQKKRKHDFDDQPWNNLFMNYVGYIYIYIVVSKHQEVQGIII
jgi:hypothetical protein